MIPCVCIDDSNRPNDFPLSKWVNEGQEYTIVEATIVLPQGILGVKLKEIEMNADCYPYKFFASSRFVFDVRFKKAIFDMVMGKKEYENVDSDILTESSEIGFVS